MAITIPIQETDLLYYKDPDSLIYGAPFSAFPKENASPAKSAGASSFEDLALTLARFRRCIDVAFDERHSEEEKTRAVCKWHQKREPRADWEILPFAPRNEINLRTRYFRIIENQRREQLAFTNVKRTMREWPVCKYSGEALKLISKEVGDATQSMHGAWHCTHCSKTASEGKKYTDAQVK